MGKLTSPAIFTLPFGTYSFEGQRLEAETDALEVLVRRHLTSPRHGRTGAQRQHPA